jgi:hypothetical protein
LLNASTWSSKYVTNDGSGGQSFGGAYIGPISPASAQTDVWASSAAGVWADAIVTLKPVAP